MLGFGCCCKKGCVVVGCNRCSTTDPTLTPAYFTVVLSGISGTRPGCACTGFNGTFTCYFSRYNSSTGYCTYLASTACGQYLALETNGSTITVYTPTIGYVFISDSYTSGFCTYSNHSLTVGTGGACTQTGATCSITASTVMLPTNFPATVYATITSPCSAIDGQTLQMDFDVSSALYKGTLNPSGPTPCPCSLGCGGGAFTFNTGGSPLATPNNYPLSVTPYSWIGSTANTAAICGCSFSSTQTSIMVTE